MNNINLTLCVLPQNYSIISLAPGKMIDLGSFQPDATLFSLTITSEEVSVICEDGSLDDYVKCENGWRAIKIINNFPLTSIGILGSVIQPLIKENINLFAISTFNTDYILIPNNKLHLAIDALSEAGHVFQPA